MKYPRTHELLSRDITRDPIFLLQVLRYVVTDAPGWDDDEGCIANYEGKPVSWEEACECGWAERFWDTRTVFLTREEGEAFIEATSYRYPNGARVWCLPAEGHLCEVLANVTEGGRYR